MTLSGQSCANLEELVKKFSGERRSDELRLDIFGINTQVFDRLRHDFAVNRPFSASA